MTNIAIESADGDARVVITNASINAPSGHTIF